MSCTIKFYDKNVFKKSKKKKKNGSIGYSHHEKLFFPIADATMYNILLHFLYPLTQKAKSLRKTVNNKFRNIGASVLPFVS